VSKRRRTIYRTDADRTAADAPNVWAVGPWDAGEFALLRSQLDFAKSWTHRPALAGAVEALAANAAPPEVLLLAQARPGVDEQELLDRLLAVAPLVRVIVVAGTWCEGELRTGRPPTGVTRLYWHELPAWWRRGLVQRAAGLAPHWSGPGEHAPTPNRSRAELRAGAQATIAVDARDFATFEALSAALRPAGWQCLWTPRGRQATHHATGGVWDGGQLDADERASLAAFCRQFTAMPAPVIALVDFPRAEHFEFIGQCGAAALMGKPYSVQSLVDALTQAMPVTALFSIPHASPSVPGT
jgi:hypothetical protein